MHFSDCVRGPEFRLRRVQLLAAAAVTVVTEVVPGARDEQHKHSAVGCSDGGKKGDGEVPLMAITSVCVGPTLTPLCVCVFAAFAHRGQGDSGGGDP